MTASESPPGERSRSVEISEDLAHAVAKRLAGTEFETVDEYVGVVVEQVLREVERTDRSESVPDEVDEPSEEVADRLESLGYL